MCDKMSSASTAYTAGSGGPSSSSGASSGSTYSAASAAYPHSVAPASEAGDDDQPWQNPVPHTVKANSVEVAASQGLTANVQRENMLFTRLGLGSLGSGSFLAPSARSVSSSACTGRLDAPHAASGSLDTDPLEDHPKPTVGYRPSRPVTAEFAAQSVTSTAASDSGSLADSQREVKKKERKSAAMHAIQQGQDLIALCNTWNWFWLVWSHHRTVPNEHQKPNTHTSATYKVGEPFKLLPQNFLYDSVDLML